MTTTDKEMTVTETTQEALPTWAEMTDLDKGAALMHLHKRDWEGAEYAEENYPARYFDHPALVALSAKDACRHAVSVENDAASLSAEENERLYDLALDTERARWEADFRKSGVAETPHPGAATAPATEPPTHASEGITGLQWDNLGSGGIG